MVSLWTIDDALDLCRKVEAIAPAFGCHVALTGGVLYKEGARKDLDLLFYRIRQVEEIDVDGLFGALSELGLCRTTDAEVWCVKARIGDRVVDCFFPDAEGGEYPPRDDADTDKTDGVDWQVLAEHKPSEVADV